MRQFAASGNPDLQRAEEEAAGMEAQLASMDAANDRSTGDLIVPKGKLTQVALDYERALREVKYRETLQDLLTRQYEGARVDEARQGSLIQVVEPAAVPDRADDSFRIWAAIGALLLCMPIGLLVGVMAELISIMRSFRRSAGSWVAALEQVTAGVWK
jgi:tyrosine-protein kinase Etk/Wzc